MPGLSRAELERTAREQLAEPPRITLARLVREASVASKDEAEFVRRLRGSGALVRPRFETGGQEEVVGYSVASGPRVGRADLVRRREAGQRPDLAAPAQFWEVSNDDRRRPWSNGAPPSRSAPAGRLWVVTPMTGDGRWRQWKGRSNA
jgi:hypothetical protein